MTRISYVHQVINQTNQDIKAVEGNKLRKIFSLKNKDRQIGHIYQNFYLNLENNHHRFNNSELKKIQPLHRKIKKFARSTNNKQLIELSKKFESTQLKPFKKLGEGSAKLVLEKKSNLKDKVYYIPISFLKKQELKNEIKTMEKINREFELKHDAQPKNLATDFKVLHKSKAIHGKFTIKVKKGIDFEEFLFKRSLTVDERLNFSRNLANGLKELHSTNHVYGDLKPENCLVFNENNSRVLKIADFGKTVLLKSKKPYKIYSGNPRYMAPEGTLSKKSDVWGAGLILIRTFEEEFLDKNGNLIKSNLPEKKSKFRGIEKYMVEHKIFHVTPKGGPTSLKTRFQAKFTSPTSKRKMAQQQELKAYLRVLQEKLSKKYNPEEVSKLIHLIERMTSPIPGRRPSMDKVLHELNEIDLS